MNKFLTYTSFLLLMGCFCLPNSAIAQAGCPGCVIDVPGTLAEDTIYLSNIVPGTKGDYYDNDLSFRMPKTTNPVAANDPGIPAGLTIDEIAINGLTNVPPGLSWEVDQTSYDPASQTDGCIKFCGTPLQSGLFVIEVSVTARIAFLSQEVTFDLEMLIEPSLSSNDGFSMTNNIGCGETTVSFQNNVLSSGQPGFHYSWDFGNGQTSIDEHPADITYSTPGTYVVKYQAVVDTVGYILTGIRLEEVACTDLISAPDIFVRIEDPAGEEVYHSGEFTNTDVPIEMSLNLKLEDGNYLLEAIDADSGLEFGDDDCAITHFNQLSNGQLDGDSYSLVLTIIHPTDTIEATDTVYVYEIPEAPVIESASETSFCEGDSAVLQSSYSSGNQWFMDGEMINGATEPNFTALLAGLYSVQYTSAEGCTSESDELEVITFELPEVPAFANTNNLLHLPEDFPLNADLSLQWYFNGDEVPGATDAELCATETGEYTLVITDQATGCTNEYATDVIIDPTYDCTVSSHTLADLGMTIQLFPNPTAGPISLEISSPEVRNLQVVLVDIAGRKLAERAKGLAVGSNLVELDLSDLASGLYLLRLESEGYIESLRVVKQ